MKKTTTTDEIVKCFVFMGAVVGIVGMFGCGGGGFKATVWSLAREQVSVVDFRRISRLRLIALCFDMFFGPSSSTSC